MFAGYLATFMLRTKWKGKDGFNGLVDILKLFRLCKCILQSSFRILCSSQGWYRFLLILGNTVFSTSNYVDVFLQYGRTFYIVVLEP
ncbi:hypothetical protein OUZ56_010710 [Daphnia magna]|uniref:Uncharacterized protein n=1 Tax=Daphnia magna TaxID=35525 RepID=A0ABQ9YYD0_9CRUS|nr:hypothetical protein OUZ56_010710 [Daphnia magna]